jgi:hypothetical protein
LYVIQFISTPSNEWTQKNKWVKKGLKKIQLQIKGLQAKNNLPYSQNFRSFFIDAMYTTNNNLSFILKNFIQGYTVKLIEIGRRYYFRNYESSWEKNGQKVDQWARLISVDISYYEIKSFKIKLNKWKTRQKIKIDF